MYVKEIRILRERGDISQFAADVYETVCDVRKGAVATYAQIALMSGHVGAARAVGNVLHVNPLSGIVPCHRVVNSSGCLAPAFAFGGIGEQANRLAAEGVEVENGRVDLYKYQFRG